MKTQIKKQQKMCGTWSTARMLCKAGVPCWVAVYFLARG